MKTIFVMVKCELGEAYDVADAAVGEIEQVSEVYSTSGQFDLLMKCYLPDSTDIGHVWTTAPVQGKNGRSATWSGAVMCSASKDAVRMTAGHDEFRGSGPNHFAAQCVPWPFRVFPIPA